MLLIVPTEKLLTVYKEHIGEFLPAKEYDILSIPGKAMRNVYIANNQFGNFIVYKFNASDNGKIIENFRLIHKTSQGESISGAGHFIHDSFYDEEGNILVLTECGAIYAIDDNFKCWKVKEIDFLSHAKEDQRGYCFYFDSDIDDFVISSNARLVYPAIVEYPVNLENPIFAFEKIVCSTLTEVALDLNIGVGKQYRQINFIKAADRGIMYGVLRNTVEVKAVKAITSEEITSYKINDTYFNRAATVSKDKCVLYTLSRGRVCVNAKILNSNTAGIQIASGEEDQF